MPRTCLGSDISTIPWKSFLMNVDPWRVEQMFHLKRCLIWRTKTCENMSLTERQQIQVWLLLLNLYQVSKQIFFWSHKIIRANIWSEIFFLFCVFTSLSLTIEVVVFPTCEIKDFTAISLKWNDLRMKVFCWFFTSVFFHPNRKSPWRLTSSRSAFNALSFKANYPKKRQENIQEIISPYM